MLSFWFLQDIGWVFGAITWFMIVRYTGLL